jgi:hypothetical protein
MNLTVTGIVTTVLIGIFLVLISNGLLAAPDGVTAALWSGLLAGLGLTGYGAQRRIPRGDYASKKKGAGLDTVGIVLISLVCLALAGCGGALADIGCKKVDDPQSETGYTWDCPDFKQFNWQVTNHPSKPKPAGVVRWYKDCPTFPDVNGCKAFPLKVTADEVTP